MLEKLSRYINHRAPIVTNFSLLNEDFRRCRSSSRNKRLCSCRYVSAEEAGTSFVGEEERASDLRKIVD
jgi:hypothetical protein